MKQVTVYTDGSCKKNPGPGGWAAILEYMGSQKEIFGGEDNTTNNRMELQAVIQSLNALTEPCNVTIFSDSKYVVDSVEKGWAKSWKKNNWVKSNKEPALNIDLWEQLLTLLLKHHVEFVWVKGHANNKMNERCDFLAQREAERIKIKD